MQVDFEMRKKQARVTVSRGGKVLSEYATLQLPSLLETGHLRADDQCQDPESGEWVPLDVFLKGVTGFSRRGTPMTAEAEDPLPVPSGALAAWTLAGLCLLIAAGAGVFAWIQLEELASLRTRLAAAEQTNHDWQQKYHQVLFAAREVAPDDMVRGRAILRDAKGKRVALPGIKVRLYTRASIESHLAARHEAGAEAGAEEAARSPAHYLKNLPPPIETTSTDSDGRFELKVPEPGEYVIQTSIRSAKSGEMRLWFVTFDARDPMNTAVDITESNAVQQLNPLLMMVEGR